MRLAYVDTSCLMAIAFSEAGARGLANRLESYDRLFSDNLLEAELRSAFAREGVDQQEDSLLSQVSWVFPAEALTAEYRRVLELGQLRGADLRHLACALYLEGLVGPIDFLSLDDRQLEVAASVGLATDR